MKIKLVLFVVFTILSCQNETKKTNTDIKHKNIDYPSYELIGEGQSIKLNLLILL